MTGQALNDISIVLGGEAGQGIQTIEQLLTKILKLDGYHVYATKEYMSRVRGGTNSISIRVSSRPVRAPVKHIDLLIPLDKDVIPHLQYRISEKTIIIGDGNSLGTNMQLIDIPFGAMAKDLGNEMYANTIALGVVLGILKTDSQGMEKYIGERFSGKGDEVVAKNSEAVRQGYAKGLEIRQSGSVGFAEINRSDISNQIMVNGSEAIAMGAIAGGCQCITSYPMTPGTGVITFMAQHMHEFDLLVEQAEDEIAAINMALGAWYAGARGMVTTSGGGFALMAEGISLAGMLELPVVVHLAQRPGPATGLPTRTEQGDLELALYAGHGEFPRILLAPESLDSAFYLTQKAFNLADKYQVPVIILSDQYLVDTYYNTDAFDLTDLKVEHHVTETAEDYKRYQLTEDGVSPRGVPGGNGLVGVDSDEHDEEGHITEDLQLRMKMVEKRLKKLENIKSDAVSAGWIGPQDYSILLLSWGSTNLIVSEALALLDRKDVAACTFTHIYPLPEDLSRQLERAGQTIMIENNATSQFGKLIQRETGHKIDHSILKYNGLPFTVEELVDEINTLLSKEETK
jgi:2-oxoglutarate ferredoxin oxidoreductase subunit alpha